MVIDEHPHRDQRRPWWFLPAVAGILVGGLVGLVTPEYLPFLQQEASPASSCDQRTWPTTEVSCRVARNPSVTTPSGVPGPWTERIWLTTLEAVDAQFHPRRQVADHPSSGRAPVWLFIYENPGTGDRVLYVAPASNAKRGAFIYVYQWPELGTPSPSIPETMPALHMAVGMPD
jgi:hypothetical protein